MNAFEPGQSHVLHAHAGQDKMYLVVQGEGLFLLQDAELPMQAGDVPSTMADVSDLERATGFRPRTSVEEGIARFVTWYREYYRV